ncbi:MAG: hypothetical protein A2X67_10095 [Ignavibacteria bacterium GWA2_55_11]|nr:MAG: hypothetical protein A2X67_10095 [Ignavibacteria bacterium GWA2_55_11]OGU63239.1 MAG: hypothetical protein A3C56_10265 [Ignavibacteria bacterium RIFCSPHIGHO2_02_FULL_56_12]OGU70953.1 MAG: hypothetical protein A3H45_12425 [Ignavibacteria bacterium RIFCSPLOWO2_02_FULL_55_14]OGU76561.1 MAG: hypothetical protein A3G43_04555 [Ignavibacteria bacterium RIFCSPLOWO2_12_FULL_56_21]
MTSEELKDRTKRFAARIVKYVDSLPRRISIDVIARQLVKSGTSIGANYRASCLARSKAEFLSKLQIVSEESDECVYWLDVLKDSGHANAEDHDALRAEALELTKIFASSLKTARSSS